MILHYFRTISAFNIPFSMMCAFLGCLPADNKMFIFCKALIVSLLTGGFILSIAAFEWRYRQSYYFYFNRGYTRTKLIGGAYAITAALVVIGLLTWNWLY